MPAKSLKRMAKNVKKPVKDAERYWKEAKKAAKKRGFKEGTEKFYRYVMGIVKRRLGGRYAATASTDDFADAYRRVLLSLKIELRR